MILTLITFLSSTCMAACCGLSSVTCMLFSNDGSFRALMKVSTCCDLTSAASVSLAASGQPQMLGLTSGHL